MKKNDTANRPFSSLSTRSFHAGGYSVAAAVIVLAIAVAVNALVGLSLIHISEPTRR